MSKIKFGGFNMPAIKEKNYINTTFGFPPHLLEIFDSLTKDRFRNRSHAMNHIMQFAEEICLKLDQLDSLQRADIQYTTTSNSQFNTHQKVIGVNIDKKIIARIEPYVGKWVKSKQEMMRMITIIALLNFEITEE